MGKLGCASLLVCGLVCLPEGIANMRNCEKEEKEKQQEVVKRERKQYDVVKMREKGNNKKL